MAGLPNSPPQLMDAQRERVRAAEARSDVVFVLFDDWGSFDVAWRMRELGRPAQVHTPALDELAGSGVKLDNYYTQHICTPTRSALLSGRYQIHTGLQDDIIQAHARVCLPPAFGTLGDAFSQLGYRTHYVGKWHIGIYRDACLPWLRGFESYYGFLTGSERHYTKIQRILRGGATTNGTNTLKKLYPDFRTQDGPIDTPCIAAPLDPPLDPGAPPPSSQGVEACYSTHVFFNRALQILRRARGSLEPKLLFVALQAVHEPVEVPERYLSPSIGDPVRRGYAGMVSAVDEGVGNLSRELKRGGRWNQTLLVVSGDNGGWRGYGGLNYPYRGHKATLWEGGVRGLGWMVAPGRIAEGRRFEGLFHVTDWLPTLVRAATGEEVSSLGAHFGNLDGVDQWGAILSRAAGGRTDDASTAFSFPRTEMLHNIEGVRGTGRAAIRVGQYKLIRNGGWGWDGWCDTCSRPEGCVDDLRKLVKEGGELCCSSRPVRNASRCVPGPVQTIPRVLLFDIDSDPSETTNLAQSQPQVVGRLLRRLAEYNASAVPCCICTGSGIAPEMAYPPREGYWTSFRDQGPNGAPECALQDLPAWRDAPMNSSESGIEIYRKLTRANLNLHTGSAWETHGPGVGSTYHVHSALF